MEKTTMQLFLSDSSVENKKNLYGCKLRIYTLPLFSRFHSSQLVLHAVYSKNLGANIKINPKC